MNPARPERGRPPSCPIEVLLVVISLNRDGLSYRKISRILNAAAMPTPGGGATWWPSHVCRLLATRIASRLRAEIEKRM